MTGWIKKQTNQNTIGGSESNKRVGRLSGLEGNTELYWSLIAEGMKIQGNVHGKDHLFHITQGRTVNAS